jgi:hypothetical protein
MVVVCWDFSQAEKSIRPASIARPEVRMVLFIEIV